MAQPSAKAPSTSNQRSAASQKPSGRKVWSDSQVADLVSGTKTDEWVQSALKSTDSRGLSPTAYAALRTAKVTGDLLPLLALLEPPEKKEESQIDLIIGLLERIAVSQTRLESRLAALESRLGVRSPGSPSQREKGVIGSPR